MKKFLKAVLRFIMKFPVHIAGVILIPSLVTSIVYLFSTEVLYYNLYYQGERIHTDPENFQLKSIKKVASVLQVSSMFSYQGGACYENYYAVVTDNFEAILIYNTENKFKVEHNISTGIVNTDWHCNQMFFVIASTPPIFSTCASSESEMRSPMFFSFTAFSTAFMRASRLTRASAMTSASPRFLISDAKFCTTCSCRSFPFIALESQVDIITTPLH